MTAALAVQESPTWQADRAALRGLGSSDAPIYAGLSTRRGKYDLWVEKVGLGYVPAPATWHRLLSPAPPRIGWPVVSSSVPAWA